jgi:hypothetical protein
VTVPPVHIYTRVREEYARCVTHEEAVARCEELQEEEPEAVFAVREARDGEWEVVRVTLPIKTPRKRQAETRAGPDVRPDPTETQQPPIYGRRGY